MPSILHKSSKFTNAGGIVLTGEDVQEAANGLVTASLNYTIEPAKAEKFNFSLDAQPPIYPRGYNTSRLQKGLLFMVDRYLSYENGLVNVKAQYAGARNVPQSGQFVVEEFETLTTDIEVQAGFVFNNDGNLVPVFDRFVISYRRKIIGYEFATLAGLNEPARQAPNAKNLVSVAYYVLRKLASPIERSYFPPRNARDLLLDKNSFFTATEETTQFVTPSVKVYSIRFFPEIESTS